LQHFRFEHSIIAYASQLQEKAVLKTLGFQFLLSAASLTLLVACGQSGNESTPALEAPAIESAPTDVMSADNAAAAEVRLYFTALADGDVVSNPVDVSFGIDGMAVVPAGQDVPNSGHHHLLIDTGLPNMSLPVPADANHVHFGDGSSSTVLTLEPGEHTLQLLFANFLHIPHATAVISDQITITVE
jgi:hypothetical protein